MNEYALTPLKNITTVFVFHFFSLLEFVDQLLPTHEVHILTIHTIMLHRRLGPIDSVRNGGSPPDAAAAAAAAAVAAMSAVATPGIDLTPDESKHSASDIWRELAMLQQQQCSFPVRQRRTRR